MNKPQEIKNQTNNFNLNEIRESLWKLIKTKTQQDWEQLAEVIKVDYPNYDQYEKSQLVSNYQNFVINHLFKWGWEKEKLELKVNKSHE